MSYASLSEKLPKSTKLWTVSDIQIWLREINMEVLYPRFRKMSVDGSCINELEERDLIDQIGIKSQMTIDKIMQWVNYRFKEYEQYLEESDNNDEMTNRQFGKTSPTLSQEIPNNNYDRQKYIVTTRRNVIQSPKIQSRFRFKSQQQLECSDNPQCFTRDSRKGSYREGLYNDIQKFSARKLFIYDKLSRTSTEVEKIPFNIGSSDHSCLQLQSDDLGYVDDCHAIITQGKQGIYSISDMNSQSGTFLKISETMKLIALTSIQIKCHRFFVDIYQGILFLTCDTLGIKMQIKTYENMYISDWSSTKIRVAQKPAHNSWIQICRIHKNYQGFVIDRFTENIDVFIRLIPKQNCEITENTLIKIGPNILKFNYFREQYSESSLFPLHSIQNHRSFPLNSSSQTHNQLLNLHYQKSWPRTNKKEEECIICCQNNRNCLVLECRHYVMCLQCSKNLAFCPICRSPITELERVYFQS